MIDSENFCWRLLAAKPTFCVMALLNVEQACYFSNFRIIDLQQPNKWNIAYFVNF